MAFSLNEKEKLDGPTEIHNACHIICFDHLGKMRGRKGGRQEGRKGEGGKEGGINM